MDTKPSAIKWERAFCVRFTFQITVFFCLFMLFFCGVFWSRWPTILFSIASSNFVFSRNFQFFYSVNVCMYVCVRVNRVFVIFFEILMFRKFHFYSEKNRWRNSPFFDILANFVFLRWKKSKFSQSTLVFIPP